MNATSSIYCCCLLFVIGYCTLVLRCDALPRDIKIGGLFDTEDEEQELAFRIAVDWLNSDKDMLPHSRLVAKVERVEEGDSYTATKKVCSLLQTGIAGIFGPQSAMTSMHVRSICDELEVPHIETRWDHLLQRDDLSINLYPRHSMLSIAYIQMLKHLGWKNFTLLYEENEGIIRLQNFLREANINMWKVQIYRFDETIPYRDTFWQVKKDLKKLQEHNQKIILDVPRRHLYSVLKHAQQVGMITENQQYLITCLDLHTLDLEDFKYSKANITGFRLVQEDNTEYLSLMQEIISRKSTANRNQPQMFGLRTETALMYDAVKMFALALQELDSGKDVDTFPPISCEKGSKGTDGTSIINYMKSSKMNGVTGHVTFDGQGFRSFFNLNLVFLTPNGLATMGSLIPDQTANITQNLTSEFQLEHRKFIVTTIVSKPYVMLKNSSKGLVGNDRFEGFCIDLVDSLSKILHFSYEIRLVKDKEYGIETKEGWSGMIGEVMRKEAHMAIAGLSINSKREQAVDFTMPFMNTGISILFKKPTTKVKSLFSFLSPFSGEVWIYLMGAYFGVSLVIFLVGRLTPYEWINPHPCRQDDIVVENTFNMRNSLWFVTGSLMQQGSDLIPTAFCTRTAASFWNFFTLIMVSSYTANLAAFLTVEKVVYPVENAEDLSKQTKIKYGCLGGGSTKQFFEDSNIVTYQRMWEAMSKNPSVLVESNEKAMEKVYEGNYAYLMEAATIEYLTERECSLVQIGGNHELTSWLSSGILKLQEEGTLHTLKERWWKQKGGGKCGDASKQSSSKVTELGLGNVGGVFVVLIFGLAAAIMVAVFEFWWKTRQYVNPDQESFWTMIKKELKLALSCESTIKPIPQLKKTAASSTVNSRSSIPSQDTNRST